MAYILPLFFPFPPIDLPHTLFEVNVVLVRQIDVEPKRATSGGFFCGDAPAMWLKSFLQEVVVLMWKEYIPDIISEFPWLDIVRWLKGVFFFDIYI